MTRQVYSPGYWRDRSRALSAGELTQPDEKIEADAIRELEERAEPDKIFLCKQCLASPKMNDEDYCERCLRLGTTSSSFEFPTLAQADAYTKRKRRAANWLNKKLRS